MSTTPWNDHATTETTVALTPKITSLIFNGLDALELLLSVIALVLNLFGNITIIISISRFSWLNQNMFIAIKMLAFADLSVCIYTVDAFVDKYIDSGMEINMAMPFIRMVCLYSAAYHVVLVSMDRFIAVIFPFQYGAYVTVNRMKMMSSLMWILSAVCSSGEIFIKLDELGYFNISLKYLSRAIPSMLVYVALVIFLCFVNGKIAIAANRQRRQIAALSSEKTHGSDRQTRMMSFVAALYILLWTPYSITSIITMFMGSVNQALVIGQRFAALSGVFNSSINCIIYYKCNSQLRRAFKMIFNLGSKEGNVVSSATYN